MSSFGLTALFEAMDSTKKVQQSNDALFEAFTDAIDDDVQTMVEKYEKLIALIPEDDEDIEDRIDEVVESVLPDDSDDWA